MPKIADMQPFIDNIMANVSKTTTVGTDSLFRTFYYDCRPYGGTETDPNGNVIDFAKQGKFTAATGFQKDLKSFPQLALRLGDLSFDGWKVDPKNAGQYLPDFKQKSVDMKIGLDIAWMSSKRTIDKIVLVAGDSDFISPMKYARREGVLVYLNTMGQAKVKLELKEHSDFLL